MEQLTQILTNPFDKHRNLYQIHMLLKFCETRGVNIIVACEYMGRNNLLLEDVIDL